MYIGTRLIQLRVGEKRVKTEGTESAIMNYQFE